TKEAIDACRDEAVEWDEDMKDLANARIDWNDEVNQGLLGRVDVLLSLDTPDKLQAEELLDRHEALVAPLDRAESLGEPSTVSDDLETRVKELGVDARTMQKLYQRRRAMLRSIRDLARTSPQGDLPDLQTALADYRAAQTTAQQARIDEQLAKVSEENEAVIRKAEEAAAAALVEAKREAAEIRGQVEADRVAAEAKRDKTLQEVADTEAQLATDREKLEREFEMDLPKIQHYLQAFITPDNYHPVKKTTVEKMPFPYSYLESRGVLAPTEEGMQRLCEMASTGVGARPRGPIPYVATSTEWRNASTQQHDTIVTAQQLLRKYGLLMVEKKMLLP
ncbi:hypothetical protein JW916_01000, partial [Candidatus Sumerlaeota bacterium]|nr:hypothetical protein [Candidatus Sumerlaeota bacterium]